tara:strand:+ start:1899 stop:4007 length:2109 start_codon:yes stop_codon:yes gene_type:complete
MPLVNFSNLDFDQIKTSIKDYLRANSNFTDYDYEGSNLSTIIDILAYNTYITSYNANMVTNEVFIDGATLRENVVSLARNIGYVPKSRNAAKAFVSFAVDTSSTTAVSVTLKRGITLVSSNLFANTSYVFSIPEDITVPVNSDGLALFDNIEVHEGTHITQSFNVSSRTPNQKYILNNSGIDTDLITVSVREAPSSTIVRTYKQFSSLYEVDSTSPVYFIQEIENERYELMFGDGVFGLKLEEPNIVEVGYITSSGEAGNGISQFTFAGQLVDNNNTSITTGISLINTDQTSFGGSAIESVESVKKNAPQIYASQNRAVTAADYEVLIPRIYPEAESVSAFGGEDLVPPQYGKVFISVKPENGVYLSTSIKEDISRELRKYSVAGIVSEIVDLKYLYVETDSYVYYNQNKAPSASVVSSLVTSNIGAYADSTELNKFGARFKYSKYQKIIDDTHQSITSNITTVQMRRDMEPLLNTFAEYELCFGNRFFIKNHGHGTHGGEIGYNIKSSAFQVAGISGDVYLGDSPDQTLKKGSLFLFKLNSPTEVVFVKQNIGIIDYVKGEIKLNPIKIISTSVNRGTPLIEVSAVPYSNDVIGLQDLYLQLDTNNVTVNTVSDQIASGDDVSGSNYIVTSSYSNGSLVRGTPILVSSESNTVSTPTPVTTNVTVTTGNAGSSVTRTTGTTPTSSPSPSTPSSSPSTPYSY